MSKRIYKNNKFWNKNVFNRYVIKTVVYEVGILTDAGNQTDLNNDT